MHLAGPLSIIFNLSCESGDVPGQTWKFVLVLKKDKKKTLKVIDLAFALQPVVKIIGKDFWELLKNIV